MADLRIPASLPAPVRAPGAAARLEAVRAAQRAFFDSALAGGATAAPTPAAAATPAVSATPLREVRAAVDPSAAPPSRPLRPGSLLDIKV